MGRMGKVIRLFSNGVLGLALAMLLTGCGQGSGDYFDGCRYGRPEPIFHDSLPEVAVHGFEIRDREGIEDVSFRSGLDLRVIQSGCDAIRQELDFASPDWETADPQRDWVGEAVARLDYLGNLGPRFLVFKEWARSLQAQRNEVALYEPVEIQPGFFVRIDPVSASGKTTLRVILSEKP